jgi:hypothetical protein
MTDRTRIRFLVTPAGRGGPGWAQGPLHRDDGLDLAADLPQAASEIRLLVLESTRPAVTARIGELLARANNHVPSG